MAAARQKNYCSTEYGVPSIFGAACVLGGNVNRLALALFLISAKV